MIEASTLVEMLERRSRLTPDAPAFRFGGTELPYQTLFQNVKRVAAHLRSLGVERGDRVLVSVPNGEEFFYAFHGALRAGAIAVPTFPGVSPERIAARALLCRAKVAVVPSGHPDAGPIRRAGEGWGLRVTTFAESNGAEPEGEAPEVRPGDVAMLQYTSGSTGDPKGVELSHDNLVTNVRQLIAGMKITEAERFVSWLPVYHDMGLILMTLVPFYLGARLVLLPTSLTRVQTWLDAIEEDRATFTAAPDFAYRLCLRAIRDPGSYDLKSLRVALNAAEPVRHSTLVSFEGAFGLEGVMVAGYGLAEATVGVSMWPPGSRPAVDGRGHVSVGKPFPGVEVRVVDGDRVLGPGEIGSLLIRSVANTRGYFENEAATAKLFRSDGYLDSGDLGSLDEEGNLYIAGRKKNIIITAGRNLSPREIEEVVDGFAGVRYSAAVGIDRGQVEGEQVFVFAELRRPLEEAASGDLAVSIVEKLHTELGVRPARVYLVKPRAIPRTYNGKTQYELLRDRYVEGSLRSEGLISFPDY